MNPMSARLPQCFGPQIAWLWAGVGAAVLCSCVPGESFSAKDATTPGAELPPSERYFPLIDGHIYQYSSRGHDGREGFIVLTVSREQNKAAITTGSTTQRLLIRPDGIYNESGYYLLKLPLKLGAQWLGQSGTVEVVRDAHAVTTDAGTFSNCIVTRETIQGTVEVRTSESTFCPGVGLVQLDVEAKGPHSATSESVTLNYYGEPFDMSAL